MSGSQKATSQLDTWRALAQHHEQMRTVQMSDLFRAEADRFDDLSLEIDGLLLDFSRNIVTRETISLLSDLVRESGVESMRQGMFAGEHLNNTEDRAALHVALRSARNDEFRDGKQDCTADVHQALEAMESFVDGIKDFRSSRVTDIVNIGIGGSDLGIVMAANALRPYRLPGVNFHAVSNIDGTQLTDVIDTVEPEGTLFVVCSKSFTTRETIVNANAAKAWIVERLGPAAVADHFVAVSTNDAAMDDFGIGSDSRFRFWDWVGGRYSLWSSVGLSLALTIGMKNFRRFLEGGRAVDRHFLEAPLDENIPVVLAGLSIWYNNFFDAGDHAILPYDNRLDRFPAFLQQMHMESNGKSVRRDGSPIGIQSSPVIFGEAGSNAQHSFYQLLHQGTRLIPVDFIATVNGSGPSQDQQDLALASCLAQAKALMDGQMAEEIRADLGSRGLSDDAIAKLIPHKIHPGNRPSTTILLAKLDPESLGKLVAIYEHKVFVEGVIWGVNSFDQWGVELGKKLADSLEAAVRHPENYDLGDPSTRGLLSHISNWRESR